MPKSLRTLHESELGDALPLPPGLAAFYGPLRLPSTAGRPYLAANFVTTLDGVTSWNLPGQMGGAPISGFNKEDTALMGLLRAASDAVIVGAATLRVVPRHLWIPEHIHPALAADYHQLRANLGKTQPPLAVIVTGSGQIDLGLRVFTSGEEPALIVTTPAGERHLRAQGVPAGVAVAAAAPDADGKLSAGAIVALVSAHLSMTQPRLLTEGGPLLMGTFFTGQAIADLFLTLAPQIAGRDAATGWRPGLVEGVRLAPEQPGRGTLVSVRQSDSHLFLRYAFSGDAD